MIHDARSFDTLFQAWSRRSLRGMCASRWQCEVEWVGLHVCVRNEFWGREDFLLLRRRSQSGFRKPSRQMCAGDAAMYEFRFSISTHHVKTVSSDRSRWALVGLMI